MQIEGVLDEFPECFVLCVDGVMVQEYDELQGWLSVNILLHGQQH